MRLFAKYLNPLWSFSHNNNKQSKGNEPRSKTKPNGISVHYLQTQFLREVQDAGKSRSSKIYELEDLRSPKYGVIRSKGANRTCPRDGKTKGAAYIDTLQGTEHVAPATFLLSYAWGYTIGDVLDSLAEWCKRFNRDPKDVFVWICCLCNNQHKVYNEKQSGVNIPFEEFHKIFRDTVVDIGHVVMMMSPFRNPIYTHRIWCVFEAYTAKISGCRMDLAMPPSAREEMIQSIHDIDILFKILGTIKIENAKASVEEDRVRILKLVEDDIGYSKLNQTVSASIRGWIMDTLEILVAEMGRDHQAGNQGEGDITFGQLLYKLGRVMKENGEFEKALGYYKQSLGVRLKLYGENHANTAACHNDIGEVFREKGDDENALKSHEKALAIYMNVHGENHPNTAVSHNNIAFLLKKKGDYDNTLKSYEKVLAIFMNVHGENHPSTAKSHNNIGEVFREKGDYVNALKSFQKALEICLNVHEENHPLTAASHNNVGGVFYERGEYDNALKSHEKALEIRLNALGENHPHTAQSHHNIGVVFYGKGEYKNAQVRFQMALEIRLNVLGSDHPSTVDTQKWLDAT